MPESMVLPAEYTAGAVGCFVRLVQEFRTQGTPSATTLTANVEAYVEVVFLADFLQVDSQLMKQLRAFTDATQAMLQRKQDVLARSPDIWGPALASKLYAEAALEDRVDIVKWFLRGGTHFCHQIDAAAGQANASQAHMQQATDHLVQAGRKAMSKIRPGQLAKNHFLCHIMWSRVLSRLGIKDECRGFRGLGKVQIVSSFIDWASSNGEEESHVLKTELTPLHRGLCKWRGWLIGKDDGQNILTYFERGDMTEVVCRAVVAFSMDG
ncbi:hypothetical protein WJX73_000339 [Symbiochloris irregularis]|uniref:Uncharacterized protein n=1 Tax=Symbiochloris irregularis TaxID=706552 RepID=A0AAW1NP86_9CHLO